MATRVVGPPAWSTGLAGYRGSPRTRIPASIHQLVSSEKIISDLLKEIYGLASQDIASFDVIRRASSDITGHLSDSGRVMVNVKTTDGCQHSYHWFVKLMPVQHQNNNLTDNFDVFRNEIEFYSKIAPGLRAFLKESNVVEDIKVDVPEMLYSQEDDKRAIIVLPDLIHEGYKQERDDNGSRYLSREKAIIAVKSLARIQATSAALQMRTNLDIERQHPSLAESGAFWTNPDMSSRLMMMKDVFCEYLKESAGLNAALFVERFNNKFNSQEELQNLCRQRYDVGDDSIKCLQHGDFHFNNLLFKEEGQEKYSVMIVDWQLSYCGRSAGDVSYLLQSSVDPHMLEGGEKTIKKEYFDTFTDTLVMLSGRCEEVTAVLEKDYQKSLPLAFFFSCGNVMQGDKIGEKKKQEFAFQLCKEAAGRSLI